MSQNFAETNKRIIPQKTGSYISKQSGCELLAKKSCWINMSCSAGTKIAIRVVLPRTKFLMIAVSQ